MKSVRYSVMNSIHIRVVVVCASTFKGSKQLTYSPKAVLFALIKLEITIFFHILSRLNSNLPRNFFFKSKLREWKTSQKLTITGWLR